MLLVWVTLVLQFVFCFACCVCLLFLGFLVYVGLRLICGVIRVFVFIEGITCLIDIDIDLTWVFLIVDLYISLFVYY